MFLRLSWRLSWVRQKQQEAELCLVVRQEELSKEQLKKLHHYFGPHFGREVEQTDKRGGEDEA